MPKWDYFVTTISKDKRAEPLAETLKGFGREGWELVAVVDDFSSQRAINRMYYFMKPLEE